MIIILDACTIINLLLIDEDDYLLSCLDCLNKKITESVFNEVRDNLKYIQKQDNEVLKLDNEYEVERKLGIVRAWQEMTIKVNGNDENFENVFNYKTKKNGEFYSSILALNVKLSEGTKVVFYTDDYVAKEHFSDYYNWHQIGYIEDTVELMVFMYTIFKDFRDSRFERFLSKIRSRYVSQITDFIKILRSCQNTLPKTKIRKINSILTQLITALEELDFKNVEKLRDDLLSEDKEYFNKTFKKYKDVFVSQNERGQIIEKVKAVKIRFASQKPYRMP